MLPSLLFVLVVHAVPGFAAQAPSPYADVAAVPLVSTSSYDPRTEPARGLKAFFSGIGVAFKGPTTDLAKMVREKLENPALRAYFPDSAERERIAETLGADVRHRTLSAGYSNRTVNAALQYLSDRLIGTVVVRVLTREGVKDVKRAGAWADKIKAPFDRCVGLSRSVIEAKKCGGPLENDLMKNIGLALSHELTRQELGAGVTAPYLRCVRAGEAGANARVRDCAIGDVRSAASAFGHRRVLEEARKQLPASAAGPIASQVLPAFDRCLQAASDRASFSRCGDRLQASAGGAIAEARVRAALRDEIPDPAAVDSIVRSQVHGTFARCLGPAPDSTRLDRCAGELEKGVAYEAAAVLVPARVTAFLQAGGGASAYGLDENGARALSRGVLAAHRQCLEGKAGESSAIDRAVNTCFKDTIRGLALRLGPLELGKTAKANGVDVATPGFQKLSGEFLGQFGACLDRKKDSKFPLADYLAGLESCQGEITRTTTAHVAKDELSRTVRQLLGDAGDEIEKRLLTDFDACTAKAASGPQTASCVRGLRGHATVTLARHGVHQRVEAELGTSELPPVFAKLDARLDACTAAKEDAAPCALSYVKEATKELGELKVDATLRPMLGDEKMSRFAAELAKLEGPFRSCVEAAPGPLDQKTLDAFEACGAQLTTDAMNFLIEHAGDPVGAPPPAAAVSAESTLTDMIARSVLCLSGSLEPGQEQALANLEPGSVEEKLLKLIGAYVAYDVKNAGSRYEETLAAVAEELQAAGPVAARRKLVDGLVRNSSADQLLKALLKAELEKAFASAPADRKLPAELASRLTDKATLDRALDDAAMGALRPRLEAGVLLPVLAEGKSLASPGVLRAFRDLRGQAVEALLASPATGLDEEARTKVRAALLP